MDIIKYLEDACVGMNSLSLDNINGARHLVFNIKSTDTLLKNVYHIDTHRQSSQYGGI